MITACVRDNFYKVIAESLAALQQLIAVLRPPGKFFDALNVLIRRKLANNDAYLVDGNFMKINWQKLSLPPFFIEIRYFEFQMKSELYMVFFSSRPWSNRFIAVCSHTVFSYFNAIRKFSIGSGNQRTRRLGNVSEFSSCFTNSFTAMMYTLTRQNNHVEFSEPLSNIFVEEFLRKFSDGSWMVVHCFVGASCCIRWATIFVANYQRVWRSSLSGWRMNRLVCRRWRL